MRAVVAIMLAASLMGAQESTQTSEDAVAGPACDALRALRLKDFLYQTLSYTQRTTQPICGMLDAVSDAVEGFVKRYAPGAWFCAIRDDVVPMIMGHLNDIAWLAPQEREIYAVYCLAHLVDYVSGQGSTEKTDILRHASRMLTLRCRTRKAFEQWIARKCAHMMNSDAGPHYVVTMARDLVPQARLAGHTLVYRLDDKAASCGEWLVGLMHKTLILWVPRPYKGVHRANEHSMFFGMRGCIVYGLSFLQGAVHSARHVNGYLRAACGSDAWTLLLRNCFDVMECFKHHKDFTPYGFLVWMFQVFVRDFAGSRLGSMAHDPVEGLFKGMLKSRHIYNDGMRRHVMRLAQCADSEVDEVLMRWHGAWMPKLKKRVLGALSQRDPRKDNKVFAQEWLDGCQGVIGAHEVRRVVEAMMAHCADKVARAHMRKMVNRCGAYDEHRRFWCHLVDGEPQAFDGKAYTTVWLPSKESWKRLSPYTQKHAVVSLLHAIKARSKP